MENEKNSGDSSYANELLSSVAAQLRGPLSAVFESVDERTASVGARKGYFALLRLAGNLSAAEELNSSEPFALTDNDILPMISSVCERTKPIVKDEKNITLTFRCGLNHMIIASDIRMLERLFLNLLSNAVKFCRTNGNILVEIKDEKPNLRLVVTDSGCGMDDAALASIYDGYLCADRLRPYPAGLGLGLPLCRRIAEGHGGSILVQTKLGEGTRVTVSLPNCRCGNIIAREPMFDYTGGFDHTLVELSDALGAEAYERDE